MEIGKCYREHIGKVSKNSLWSQYLQDGHMAKATKTRVCTGDQKGLAYRPLAGWCKNHDRNPISVFLFNVI
jgi:hypothetical protein